MKSNSHALGYVVAMEDGGVFRGAALVTDYRGIPLDFRYTEPISPTKIERILYGESLDVYLQEEVILGSLIDSVETKPALWLCGRRELLPALHRRTGGRSLVLETTNQVPLDNVGESRTLNGKGEHLLQVNLVSSPLHVILPESGEETFRQMASILVEAALTMELEEPFSRIMVALAAIDEDEKK